MKVNEVSVPVTALLPNDLFSLAKKERDGANKLSRPTRSGNTRRLPDGVFMEAKIDSLTRLESTTAVVAKLS